MQVIDQLRLARTEGVGPVSFRRLLRRYGSARAALEALPALARAGGRASAPAVPSTAAASREMERLAKLGGRLCFLETPEYPPLLALLDDAPPVIAILGRLEAVTAQCVALVGGRNASANGQRMAEGLAEALASAGVTVVSGLARGVDGAAHRGALRAGRTVAAIAGGLDVPYPPEHADLQRQIAEAGAVIAEAPLGTTPQARHFPRGNRIIAGLSLGVVVVEAAPRSGSWSPPGSRRKPAASCSRSRDLRSTHAAVAQTISSGKARTSPKAWRTCSTISQITRHERVCFALPCSPEIWHPIVRNRPRAGLSRPRLVPSWAKLVSKSLSCLGLLRRRLTI